MSLRNGENKYSEDEDDFNDDDSNVYGYAEGLIPFSEAEDSDFNDDDSNDYGFEEGLINDDPKLDCMCFCDDRDLVDAIEGELIGRHTHLKRMIFSDFDAPKELFDAYLRGVAKNRSIEELVFSEPYENKWGGIFRILAPFLANNSNLR
jgi:hypothetical protein